MRNQLLVITNHHAVIGLGILSFLCIAAMWYRINVVEHVDRERDEKEDL